MSCRFSRTSLTPACGKQRVPRVYAAWMLKCEAPHPRSYRIGCGTSRHGYSREDERDAAKDVRVGRVGFKGGRLYKTEAFLEAHPFGAVPATFSPDGKTGIFELHSIMRTVARLGHGRFSLYGSNADDAARIDRFLDARLIFARDAQLSLLSSAASCRKCWTKFRQLPKFGTVSFVNSRVLKGLRLACALHLVGSYCLELPSHSPGSDGIQC